MGRNRCYRERIQFEMGSVRAKSLGAYLNRLLKAEYGRSRIEAGVLAERSLEWLLDLGVSQLPGQMRVSVPATAAKRYARARRLEVLVTAAEVAKDTEVWETFGLEALQRHRLLRWLMQIQRQGGWASLTELAAWANLTPTALGTRLRPVRELGVWLPHVGGSLRPQGGALPWEAWLVERYLETGEVEEYRCLFGLTVAAWERVLRVFAATVELTETDTPLAEIGSLTGRSEVEVDAFLAVVKRHAPKRLLRELRAAYGPGGRKGPERPPIQRELVQEYGFSPVAARLYERELRTLASRIGGEGLEEGETVFFAISAEESARATLEEARHVPVRLHYFTAEDLERGPYGPSRTRVSELKWARILRYATEARAQGALLTLPDLAVLLGIHVDAVRHQIARHPEVIVPTRGRIKDIGRGVSHKAGIVELYLQMHTETEIVERTSHSYESVEAYLKEFARVVTLADRGMNSVMIRRVVGRSMALVNAYLELYRRYDRSEYHFRLAQIRRVFAREEALDEKRGLHSSRIGGPGP